VTDFFPFQRLGLSGNPFRALTNEEWAAAAVVAPEHLATLTQPGAHTQVLAPAGHGKTTLLLAAHAHLAAHGARAAYEYLPEGARAFHTPLAGLDVLVLDEAQRLAPPEWTRLLAAARAEGLRLVLSSHQDLAPRFARAGLPLTTLALGPASLEQLRAIVARRLALAALGAGPAAWLGPAALGYLHARCGGNLRRAEHWLYEVFQTFPEGEITAEALRAVEPQG
jgi:hypothetical protein